MTAVATSLPPALERYRAAFEALPRAQDDLAAQQRAALQRFLAAGFPTQRLEEWKYTNLRRLETRTFAPAPAAPSMTTADTERFVNNVGQRYVFINGRWNSALSGGMPQPPGLTALALSHWRNHEPARVGEVLNTHAGGAGALVDLNAAFMDDGLIIEISDNARVDEPIYFVHVWSHGARALMSHPRIVIRAGRNSRCTFIEHYLGSGDGECFTNAVADIALSPGAAITHYRVQQESPRDFHIATTRVQAREDSRYVAYAAELGGGLARHSTTCLLESPGASVAMSGLFTPSGSQHSDIHTRVEHRAPQTVSEQEFRGIAAERGRGVFNGKVVVHPHAQKIDARQSSRNLLLSATAEIDTRPELEIYANDVKCSHGATTGQLDATALFYLRTRGLSPEAARAALIQAFAGSILTGMTCAPVREHVERALHGRYAIGASS